MINLKQIKSNTYLAMSSNGNKVATYWPLISETKETLSEKAFKNFINTPVGPYLDSIKPIKTSKAPYEGRKQHQLVVVLTKDHPFDKNIQIETKTVEEVEISDDDIPPFDEDE